MKDDIYGNWKRSEEGKRQNRKSDYVSGVWENITDKPIYIKDKEHLKKICDKYGVIPKIFAKAKSQGKGVEWNF